MRRIRLATLACLIGLWIGGSAGAQSPRLDRIERAGGMRGSQFTVECLGENLDHVDDVIFYSPGLSLRDIGVISEERIQLVIQSESDCRLGEHALRLSGTDGISELRSLHISPYTQALEQEPNDHADQAQRVDWGVTLHGSIEEGDLDTYRVTLQKGQRLAVEVVAVRLGSYVTDAWLSISNAAGEVLAESDDTALLRLDPLASIVAPSDGDYFISVREASYGGDSESIYQLHLGGHPRPTVAYPAGGRPGEEVDLELRGDAAGPARITARIPLHSRLGEPSGRFDLFPEDEFGVAPTPLPLRVSPAINVLESEPNDTAADATPTSLELPLAFNGILEAQGDVDFFRFRGLAGQRFEVKAFAERIGSPADTVVAVAGSDGREIVRNDDGAGQDSEFRFVVPRDGDYTVAVTDHLGRGGSEFVYRIEFLPVEPEIVLSIPSQSDRRPQQGQAIEVARGGRFAMLVAARRSSLSAAIELLIEGLPPGVRATTQTIEPGTHLGYLVIEASENAPLDGGLLRLIGRAQTPAGVVVGELRQQVGLVFGPPRNTAYHSFEVSALPIRVTPEPHLTLEVVPPAVPLVKDGVVEILAEVTRSRGLDGEIELKLPLLPPWLEFPEDGVRIPAGESQTRFQLTSTADAESRTWPLIVTAEGRRNGQTVVASSAVFPLTVREPYVDLTIRPAATSQGRAVEVQCDVKWLETSGPATARLHGLPDGASSPDIELRGDESLITFPIRVEPQTPAAIHNTLYVELAIGPTNQRVTHYLGRGGVLEVFAAGGQARDKESRLDVLRRKANAPPSSGVPTHRSHPPVRNAP